MAFKIYNVFAKGLYILRYPFLHAVRKNKVFKNKHKGERCFILGLGPSLKNVDLGSLKNETLFAVNSYYLFDTEKTLRPKYYFMLDSKFRNELFDEVLSANEAFPDAAFFYNIRQKKHNKKMLRGRKKNSHYLYSRYIPHGNFVRYKAHKNTTMGMNVVHGCIQTALYMGFKEIYLLGCDFNYIVTDFKQEHCYSGEADDGLIGKDKETLSDSLQYLSAMLKHHNALDKCANKKGSRIFNLTPGSFIKSYEFKNLEDVLGNGK
jgi:hypothetical protein